MLLDSGADISLLRLKEDINLMNLNKNTIVSMKGINEETVNSIGTIESNIIINNYNIPHIFHLVDKDFPLATDGLLGQDFINKHRCVLDYNQWNFKNGEFTRTEIKKCSDLQIITVPPRTEIFTILSKPAFKGDVVVKSKEIKQGVFIGNSIISEKNPIVRILNVNYTTAHIKNLTLEFDNLDCYEIQSPSMKTSERAEKIIKNIQESNSHLTEELKQKLFPLISKFNGAFALEKEKLSANNFYTQKIRTSDDNPVYTKNYRIPHAHKEEIQKQVEKMLDDNIIEPSVSEYNSPILLVPKKALPGSAEKRSRLVIDYRKLNKKVVGDVFPIPRIEDILDQLGSATWFSVLDLQSGFHQIPLDKDSRDLTSFSTETGSYRFTRVPFGLKISPNSFARMMSIAFSGLAPDKAFVYIDDLIILGKSTKSHLENLEAVFKTCEKYNLKLNPKKCIFFKQEVTYLGHKCTSEGIKIDDSKYSVILDFPIPKNADEVKRFVAFCNYYRKFIKNFAEITRPLNALTRKNTQFSWNSECQQAFENLKKNLINPPILQYPDFNKPFILTCDASKYSCGAVLSQMHGKDDLPVALTSRNFTKGESNKPAIEQELLAIFFGIKYFKPYLAGRKFLVRSDHKPLSYVFALKDPSSRLTRIRLDLEEFDFDIEYVKGKENVVADCLSRISIDDLKNMCQENKQILVVTRSMSKKNSIQKEKESQVKKTLQKENPKIIFANDNAIYYEKPLLKIIKQESRFMILIKKKNKILRNEEMNENIINDLGQLLKKLNSLTSELKLDT
jgi:hypothetical protein